MASLVAVLADRQALRKTAVASEFVASLVHRGGGRPLTARNARLAHQVENGFVSGGVVNVAGEGKDH